MIDLFMFLCLRRCEVRLVYRVRMWKLPFTFFSPSSALVFPLARSLSHVFIIVLMINLLLSKEGITFLFASCLFSPFLCRVRTSVFVFHFQHHFFVAKLHLSLYNSTFPPPKPFLASTTDEQEINVNESNF
jgi:hypothetical protein